MNMNTIQYLAAAGPYLLALLLAGSVTDPGPWFLCRTGREEEARAATACTYANLTRTPSDAVTY
jgi:hypothetical protein